MLCVVLGAAALKVLLFVLGRENEFLSQTEKPI